MHVLSNPNTVPCTIVPPSLIAHESLWQKFHEYFDVLHPSPKIAVNKLWCCVGVWLYLLWWCWKNLEAIMDSRLFWDRTKVAVTGQQSTKAAAVCVRSVLVKHNLAAFCCNEEGMLIFKKCQNLLQSFHRLRSWCSYEWMTAASFRYFLKIFHAYPAT